MKMFFCFLIFLSSFNVAIGKGVVPKITEGEEVKSGNRKVIYTYKQYEKFDFDDLNIEGDGDMQNDLSIPPIHEKQFSNKLPYRKSFTAEIKKGIERVR